MQFRKKFDGNCSQQQGQSVCNSPFKLSAKNLASSSMERHTLHIRLGSGHHFYVHFLCYFISFELMRKMVSYFPNIRSCSAPSENVSWLPWEYIKSLSLHSPILRTFLPTEELWFDNVGHPVPVGTPSIYLRNYFLPRLSTVLSSRLSQLDIILSMLSCVQRCVFF